MKAYCLFSSFPNTYNIYCEHLWPKHTDIVSRWLYKGLYLSCTRELFNPIPDCVHCSEAGSHFLWFKRVGHQ